MKHISLALVLLACVMFFSSLGVAAQSEHQHTTDPITQQVRYVCPMHSHIVKDHPGTCPICGMDLEPVKRSANEGDNGSQVTISGEMQQAMALVTETVRRDDLWKYIQTLGTATFDEANISHIHPRASGWLESLTPHAIGEPVEKGELLFTLYSPELVVAQDDYLQVLNNTDGRVRERMLQQGRLRLKLLGMDDSVIRQLEESRQSLYTVPFYAQRSGVLTELNVRHGMYVTPDIEMMAIADLSQLWVIADVFEDQFDWLQEGRPASIHFPGIGVHDAEATIDYIYPQLDPVTRSLKVRLRLDNPLKRIKAGMTAKVEIFGGPLRDVLVVNGSAIIRGANTSRVVVRTDDDRFEVRRVETGMQAQGKSEILYGLSEGEQVVTSGQFLIDSEASLSGGLNRTDSGSHANH
ncbi:efflux RND transporter periplasmic adaptor subunit [Lacimicrobium sp. SS2-24]|uniref:efflux RND transporter periplasmic adaptor subunit n=1 Tax=Lacimicrobium sp. SS2-24 TaxID=2005569 RepID=UPI000B4ABA20|nr:efflux RND transporter periplasmic adaptor subunit [Lacimicrobium sp. SS2-24]